MELKKVEKPQLSFEYKFYILGNDPKGFPKVHYYGGCGQWQVLVMELLGPTLYKIHEKCGLKFSLRLQPVSHTINCYI